MTTRERAYHLLQTTYYDGIDRGDMATATSALGDDVDWSHAQVWAHHGFARAEASALRGRQAVFELLAARVAELAEARITHHVDDLVIEGGKGAFLGHVAGPGGVTRPFMVWFEIANDRISRYTLRPL